MVADQRWEIAGDGITKNMIAKQRISSLFFIDRVHTIYRHKTIDWDDL